MTSEEILAEGNQMVNTLTQAFPGIASQLTVITAKFAQYGAAAAVEQVGKAVSAVKVVL